MSTKTMYNIPNLLCYFRVAVILPMALLFFIDAAWAAWLNTFLWILAGLSDLLDGIIARATGQTTLLGKFLDSSADKMLIAAVLMLLVGTGQLTGIWILMAITIILREILIAGIREFMALYNIIVPISKLGKWKLTVQMVAIGFLLPGVYGSDVVEYSLFIGKILFLGATVITVVSGWDYMKKGYETMLDIENKTPAV